jgi:hypothetical protein
VRLPRRAKPMRRNEISCRGTPLALQGVPGASGRPSHSTHANGADKMRKLARFSRTTVAAIALLGSSGCAGLENLGGLADILGAAGGMPGAGQQQQGQVTAEIQSVNTSQQRIQLRTQAGETGAVMYDQNTVVVYQQQQYPVTALEAGDVANFQLQQAANNNLYAARIDVVQSVQERTGQTTGGGQLYQLAGRVGGIDQNRGTFELQTQNGVVLVSLPYNPGNATVERFRRLRTGDSVGVEGHMVAQGRVELTRFL